MNRMWLLAGMAVGVLDAAAIGDVINVGPGGSIQAAVDAAQDGDEIVVAPGTYIENIQIEGKDLTLRSSDGAEVTILRPHELEPGDPILWIVLSDVVVNGFTLTGGDAGANLGMMYVFFDSNVQVVNCLFSDTGSKGFAGAKGLRVDGASVTVWGCDFSNLRSRSKGGAIEVGGTAGDEVIIVDCRFLNNLTGDQGVGGGGALSIGPITIPPIVANCLFVGNTDIKMHGGAIHVQSANPIVMNCVFVANEAEIAGGAIYSDGSDPLISNCTFTDNTAALGGAIFNDGFSFPVISNSIFWDNFPFQIYDSDSLAQVIFCDVEGGWDSPGSFGVIDADPMLADVANGDYRLQPGSPCIDAGHNLGVLPDLVDLDGDGDTAEFTPLDLDGNARFADDPATADTGCGVPGVVDMGAFEFAGDPFVVKLGDINGDCVVGINDLLALLALWGSCTEACCLADLDLDADVGITDFLILLANWGPCL